MKNTVAFISRRPRLLGEFRQILSVSCNVKEGCREFTALIYKDIFFPPLFRDSFTRPSTALKEVTAITQAES